MFLAILWRFSVARLWKIGRHGQAARTRRAATPCEQNGLRAFLLPLTFNVPRTALLPLYAASITARSCAYYFQRFVRHFLNRRDQRAWRGAFAQRRETATAALYKRLRATPGQHAPNMHLAAVWLNDQRAGVICTAWLFCNRALSLKFPAFRSAVPYRGGARCDFVLHRRYLLQPPLFGRPHAVPTLVRNTNGTALSG